MKTVVGLFNSTAAAEQVKQALVSNGYQASNITVVANDSDYEDDAYATSGATPGTMSRTSDGRSDETLGGYDEERNRGRSVGSSAASAVGSGARKVEGEAEGIGHKIGNFFHNLVGGDEDTHEHYAQGVNGGGALLTARVEDDQAQQVAAMLQQHGARQIEGGSGSGAGYGQAGSGQTGSGLASGTEYGNQTGNQTGREMDRGNLTGEQAIPVVQEDLVVGKREVDRGGVRIYSHVVERPAEADVTLREERVNVERRPVNRPATAADFQTGSGSFELRASAEEAVVGKTSRVVEEVMIGKQTSERTEQIHDTVRKTEVDVEQLAGETGTRRTSETDEADRLSGSRTGDTKPGNDRY